MPIYEYDCSNCKKIIEVMQKFSDALLSECPDCGQAGITKRMSLSSFSLKGSGWYSTDYKKSSQAPASSSETSSAASSNGSADSSAGTSSPAPASSTPSSNASSPSTPSPSTSSSTSSGTKSSA